MLNFSRITRALRSRPLIVAPEPVPVGQTGSESVQHQCRNEARTLPKGDLKQHSPHQHALLAIDWTQRNIDLSVGMIFYDQMIEFYTEAVIEAGWRERSWNPIARELDLICTGGRKPYEWIITRTGQKRRRRVYPIPGRRTETENSDGGQA
jgi:hypothetical protein